MLNGSQIVVLACRISASPVGNSLRMTGAFLNFFLFEVRQSLLLLRQSLTSQC